MTEDFVVPGNDLGNNGKKKRGRRAGIKPNEIKEKNPFKSGSDNAPVTVKKGKKAQFRPASKLGYFNAPDGFTPRWVNGADQGNIMKKKAEGWEFVNATTLPGFEQVNEIVRKKEVTESGGLGNGVLRHNEMVAMVLPNEIKESRDEYFKNITDMRTRAKIDMEDQKQLLGAYRDNITNTLTVD